MSVTSPQGFVAAGGHIGIKASGAPDLALVATADGQPVAAAAPVAAPEPIATRPSTPRRGYADLGDVT